MVTTPPMDFSRRCRNRAPGFGPEVSNAFLSLDEARNNLDWHWNTCEALIAGRRGDEDNMDIKSIQGLCDKWVRDYQSFAAIIEQWSTAFQAFLRKASNHLDTRELQAAHILEIHYIFLKMYTRSGSESLNVKSRKGWLDYCNNQMAWDHFLPLFDRIISLASLIVDSSCIFHESNSRFCLDSNIVAPLYAVAHRCRDPLIRRKAVSLLQSSPRQEGIWDSVLATKAAEIVIAVEEEGLGNVTSCADIPDWARICDVKVNFDMEGRVGTVNFSWPKNGMENRRPTVVETFTC